MQGRNATRVPHAIPEDHDAKRCRIKLKRSPGNTVTECGALESALGVSLFAEQGNFAPKTAVSHRETKRGGGGGYRARARMLQFKEMMTCICRVLCQKLDTCSQ